MTSTHVDADVVSPSLQEMLRRAADVAALEVAAGEQISDNDIRALAAQVVARTLETCTGDSSSDAPHRAEAPDTDLQLRIHDALRSALLGLAAREPGRVAGHELATVLLALDQLPIGASSEKTGEFVRQIARAEAVNAVVEIAHDMRSPLTSILFLVETIKRGRSGPVTPVQERQLGLIYGAALGLNALACDVIDAVRGGQRLFDGDPIPFSIAEVMLGVCDTVRPISEEKGLPITQTLPVRDGRIGYPGALGRVLLNLLTNALKYTDEGSVHIGATELSDTRLSFWVSDTGAGIPAGAMDRLFDGFRPTTTGMRFSNSGLGLAICQDFLRHMDATLDVKSRLEGGTRFSFEIDLAHA